MREDGEIRSYLFEICASSKVDGKYPGYQNLIIHVVSDRMEGAVETFRTEFPDAILHKVERRNYMGKNAVMIDPKIAQ